MNQDPIHIEHARLVDTVDACLEVSRLSDRKMQENLLAHLTQGVPYDFELDRFCSEARKNYATARKALSDFSHEWSLYFHPL